MKRTQNIDSIQSDEYSFPYHYIPNQNGFPRFARAWNFSPSYLAAIGLFLRWLQTHRRTGLAPHRHIDIGCGDGGFINAVSGSGNFSDVAFTGVDYDNRAVFWAQAFAREGCTFECKPLAALGGGFDSASLVEVLEHIPPNELKKFVAEVAATLVDGAPLFVTVPSTEKRIEAKHYQHFDFERIAEVLSSDFEVVEVKGFERYGLLGKAVRKLTQGKSYYIEAAWVSDYLVATCERTHEKLKGCGRIYVNLRKKRSSLRQV